VCDAPLHDFATFMAKVVSTHYLAYPLLIMPYNVHKHTNTQTHKHTNTQTYKQAALAAVLGGATRADSFADGGMAGAENAWDAPGGHVHGGDPPQL